MITQLPCDRDTTPNNIYFLYLSYSDKINLLDVPFRKELKVYYIINL